MSVEERLHDLEEVVIWLWGKHMYYGDGDDEPSSLTKESSYRINRRISDHDADLANRRDIEANYVDHGPFLPQAPAEGSCFQVNRDDLSEDNPLPVVRDAQVAEWLVNAWYKRYGRQGGVPPWEIDQMITFLRSIGLLFNHVTGEWTHV